jgi:3-phenylpropionate/trans-cinnamate dioxygenase ferredoxin reductase subunit
MAGIALGHDRTLLRGDVSQPSFSVLYAKGELVLAADTVNAPREHLALRKLIAQRAPVELERLCDPAVPLPA